MLNGSIFNYKTKKIKNKGKSSIIFKSLAITFSLLIILMFAGAMTGGFFAGISGGSSISFAASDYYALSAGYFDSLTSAENAANNIKVRGGAGYIHSDRTYIVLAALYKDKDSANKVAVRMGSTFSVYKIHLPAFKLPTSGDSAQDAKIKAAIQVFYDSFEELYDICIQLDSGALQESGAAARLKAQMLQVAQVKLALDSVSHPSHAFIMLRAELLSLSINLNLLEDYQSLGYSLSVSVKYYLIRSVLNLRNFILEAR